MNPSALGAVCGNWLAHWVVVTGLRVCLLTDVFLHPNTALERVAYGTLWADLHSWCFSRLSSAVRDEADGEAVQPHKANHLSEPILVNVTKHWGQAFILGVFGGSISGSARGNPDLHRIVTASNEDDCR